MEDKVGFDRSFLSYWILAKADLWVASISEPPKIIVLWSSSELFEGPGLYEDIHPRRFIADKADCSLYLWNSGVGAMRRSGGI
jgi:hypothetical protein